VPPVSAQAAGSSGDARALFAARVARVLRTADELERQVRPAASAPRLVVTSLAGAAWLPRGDRVLIGRGARCDVVLASRHVSREHAVLLWRGGAWWVEDLDSSNGTFVDGRRVTLRRVGHGDVLVLGDTPLKIAMRW
jgi:hypothetical protein